MFNGLFDTQYPYKSGGVWGPFEEVRYNGVSGFRGMGGIRGLRGLADIVCSAETAGYDMFGNALDINGNKITCDTSGIGVNCVNGTCTDLSTGETFDDPTPMAVGIGLAVGAMVNPIVGAIAGFAAWYTAGPKPGTGVSH
jgi:hypothetical protein